jgi:phosphopantothenoylcysteine decarboxylase/phosphopantothenate--cysteine ligase
MRHGADVHAVMSDASLNVIHPNLMEWATGNPVVTSLSGKIEHVAFTTGARRADLLLVAPATANTIGKMAAGIDDTPVTSFVSSALGAGIPILVAPAMHDTMINHPVIRDNISKLRAVGVEFLEPTLEEGKAKLQEVQDIVEAVIARLAERRLAGMRVLVTGGPTLEPIDPVRVLTNRSSGKMAVALARAAKLRGAEQVTLVYGPGTAKPPGGVRVVRVETAQQMLEAIESELKNGKEGYDLAIAAAAVSDFRPTERSPTKIPSSTSKTILRLTKTRKVVKEIKKISPSTFLTIFAAEYLPSRGELTKKAAQKMKEADADMVAVNDVGVEGIGFDSDENEVTVMDASGGTVALSRASKREIADRIVVLAAERIEATRERERGSRTRA